MDNTEQRRGIVDNRGNDDIEEQDRQVRESLQYAVAKICAQDGDTHVSVEAARVIAELVYLYATAPLANDLASFASHANRRTVSVDDVLLVARKDPNGLQKKLKIFHDKGKKARKYTSVDYLASRAKLNEKNESGYPMGQLTLESLQKEVDSAGEDGYDDDSNSDGNDHDKRKKNTDRDDMSVDGSGSNSGSNNNGNRNGRNQSLSSYDVDFDLNQTLRDDSDDDDDSVVMDTTMKTDRANHRSSAMNRNTAIGIESDTDTDDDGPPFVTRPFRKPTNDNETMPGRTNKSNTLASRRHHHHAIDDSSMSSTEENFDKLTKKPAKSKKMSSGVESKSKTSTAGGGKPKPRTIKRLGLSTKKPTNKDDDGDQDNDDDDDDDDEIIRNTGDRSKASARRQVVFSVDSSSGDDDDGSV